MSSNFNFSEALSRKPFLEILGKYDHILGPRALYHSPEINDEAFISRVVRDALHTKSKYIILDFETIYAQGAKIEVEDENARGRKQLYVIILLRDVKLPQIPIIHFKRMEMLFHKLGRENILTDNVTLFENYFSVINEIYMDKKEILPIESLNLQIRSGLNTIMGFCDIILEEYENKREISMEDVIFYVKMMSESCSEIIKALDTSFS
ncbi:MAG: hypothetical protein ACTSVI_12305 [Promethearchaeota archaeon]